MPFNWLTEVYRLVEHGQIDVATDLVFERIDDLLLAGEFEQCDELLQQVDLQRLDSNLLVALLSITLVAHTQLPFREKFYKAVRRELHNQAVARVDSMLSGLAYPPLQAEQYPTYDYRGKRHLKKIGD